MINIEVRSATKCFDNETSVLNGLDLNVTAGSIYSLIGPSGCGKTTLLTCILGMKRLDSGTIKVLGENVSYDKASKFSQLIGYMPQETALVPELTIKETLSYFGNIYQMNQTLLKQRLVMICELLELNDVNKQVKYLSGGEQRRVSFASALIHDPTILILDEPTVGLDSLLREKIWTFLNKSTRLSIKTVIITTHYIAEAEKSDYCGMMRNGVLLIEDSPQNIYRSFRVSNLEEAFLSLCMQEKTACIKNNIFYSNERNFCQEIDKTMESQEETKTINAAEKILNFNKRRSFAKQTLLALFNKELKKIFRQPYEIGFAFIFPLLQVICITLSAGKFSKDLSLGIVNRDVIDPNFCSEYLQSTNYQFNTSVCTFEYLSCYFLREIDDKSVRKVYYKSFDEAFKEAKATKTFGFISISSNFTEVLSERKFDWQPIGQNLSYSNQISVYLDHTNLHHSMHFKYKLWKSFEKFNKKMLQHCELDERLEDIPLRFETFYAELDDDYTLLWQPLCLVIAIIFAGILFSISSFSQNRIEGTWNRTILAGVTTSEILFAQMIILSFCNIIQLIMLKITFIFCLDIPIIGNQLILGMLCLCLYITANSIGLFISVLTNNVIVLNSAGLLAVLPNLLICGALWPLEGLPLILKYISYILPPTLTVTSIRNIALKGFPLTHITVYGGFLLLFVWILLMLILCYWILKMKRYSV